MLGHEKVHPEHSAPRRRGNCTPTPNIAAAPRDACFNVGRVGMNLIWRIHFPPINTDVICIFLSIGHVTHGLPHVDYGKLAESLGSGAHPILWKSPAGNAAKIGFETDPAHIAEDLPGFKSQAAWTGRPADAPRRRALRGHTSQATDTPQAVCELKIHAGRPRRTYPCPLP